MSGLGLCLWKTWIGIHGADAMYEKEERIARKSVVLDTKTLGQTKL